MKKSSPVSRSGRFASGPGADVAQFTESISFDWRLWKQDILGSIAHATMLQKIGVLTKAELTHIAKGPGKIGQEIFDGKFEWKPELEDVHMNIEAELTQARSCRSETAHRAFAQRPGRARYPDVAAR